MISLVVKCQTDCISLSEPIMVVSSYKLKLLWYSALEWRLPAARLEKSPPTLTGHEGRTKKDKRALLHLSTTCSLKADHILREEALRIPVYQSYRSKLLSSCFLCNGVIVSSSPVLSIDFILQGDELMVTCHYNTQGRTNMTYVSVSHWSFTLQWVYPVSDF